jgi:prepilin-type N-terminal cleavage/methylation domain-containing protein
MERLARRVRERGDEGDTLVEILVALAILGIGISALLVALATNASTTVVSRDQAQAGTALVAAAEWVKAQPFSSFTCDATPPAVAPAGTVITATQPPAGFVATYGVATPVAGATCASLVRIPVTVTQTGHDYSVSLDVIRRA